MQPEKRRELEERRRQLQQRREAESYMETYVHPYLEVLGYLNQQAVPYKLGQLMYLNEDWYGHVTKMIQATPYNKYSFPVLSPSEMKELQGALDQLFDCYPSTNPLRYVPSLRKFADYSVGSPRDDRKGLEETASALKLSDQRVYLYYLRYSPILELSLMDILKHDNEDLFNWHHGDAVIFPTDRSWLMAFTLEEEWYGGRRVV
jgi:hypothetical protein